MPDGSAWLVDEVAVTGGDEAVGARGVGPRRRRAGTFEAAGRLLARRMLAAGAADLLRDAEAMAAR